MITGIKWKNPGAERFPAASDWALVLIRSALSAVFKDLTFRTSASSLLTPF